MRKLMYLALALGLVVPASAVGKTASGSTGLTASRLTCADFLDGNGQMINQKVGFGFQLVNRGAGDQVVNLEFTVPVRNKPVADPQIALSPSLIIPKPKPGSTDPCPSPGVDVSVDPPKAHCHAAPPPSPGLKDWICANVSVPAGNWRWLYLKVAFAKPGNRVVSFWAGNELVRTRAAVISTGL